MFLYFCLFQWSLSIKDGGYWADPCITKTNTACSFKNKCWGFCLELLDSRISLLWNSNTSLYKLYCISWKKTFSDSGSFPIIHMMGWSTNISILQIHLLCSGLGCRRHFCKLVPLKPKCKMNSSVLWRPLQKTTSVKCRHTAVLTPYCSLAWHLADKNKQSWPCVH